jgi:hypothetical protein
MDDDDDPRHRNWWLPWHWSWRGWCKATAAWGVSYVVAFFVTAELCCSAPADCLILKLLFAPIWYPLNYIMMQII